MNDQKLKRMMVKNMNEELNDYNFSNLICYGSIDPKSFFKNQVIVTQNDIINYNNKNKSSGNYVLSLSMCIIYNLISCF